MDVLLIIIEIFMALLIVTLFNYHYHHLIFSDLFFPGYFIPISLKGLESTEPANTQVCNEFGKTSKENSRNNFDFRNFFQGRHRLRSKILSIGDQPGCCRNFLDTRYGQHGAYNSRNFIQNNSLSFRRLVVNSPSEETQVNTPCFVSHFSGKRHFSDSNRLPKIGDTDNQKPFQAQYSKKQTNYSVVVPIRKRKVYKRTKQYQQGNYENKCPFRKQEGSECGTEGSDQDTIPWATASIRRVFIQLAISIGICLVFLVCDLCEFYSRKSYSRFHCFQYSKLADQGLYSRSNF